MFCSNSADQPPKHSSCQERCFLQPKHACETAKSVCKILAAVFACSSTCTCCLQVRLHDFNDQQPSLIIGFKHELDQGAFDCCAICYSHVSQCTSSGQLMSQLRRHAHSCWEADDPMSVHPVVLSLPAASPLS